IRYFVKVPGGSWTATTFAHPAHRLDLDPQIAFRGDVVYVAYSRIALDDGCGSDGNDIGVYVRTRSQPSGSWSAPTRIGLPDDSLGSFRVDGGTVHATVRNEKDGRVYYET